MKNCISTVLVSVVGAVLFSAGCATLPESPTIRRIKPAQQPQSFAERKQTAVQEFERQRDAAQVQAAINHWQRGDVPKSMAMLTAIIERTPSDVNARLRLAEVLTSQEDFAGAETQLRACLTHEPDSAEVHHVLGMLLSEAPGREQEAQQHLRRAAELEPENELYVGSAG